MERSGAKRSGAGGAEPRRRLPSAEGRGRSAARRSGWLEFLGLARCVGYVGGKRSSPKAQPQGREGSGGIVGVSGLGSLRLACAVEEVKPRSPTIEGQPATKITIIPKIPIIIDVLGS